MCVCVCVCVCLDPSNYLDDIYVHDSYRAQILLLYIYYICYNWFTAPHIVSSFNLCNHYNWPHFRCKVEISHMIRGASSYVFLFTINNQIKSKGHHVPSFISAQCKPEHSIYRQSGHHTVPYERDNFDNSKMDHFSLNFFKNYWIFLYKCWTGVYLRVKKAF